MNKLLRRAYHDSPVWLQAGMRTIFYSFLLMRSSIGTALIKNKPIGNINLFERRVFSQHGEDGVIQMILERIGVRNKFCVEFGVGDGSKCNTRYLVEKEGWNFLWMDVISSSPTIMREFVTAENVNSIFAKYGVPKEFDCLSIDVDYNTYWIWSALEGYHARLVVIEYNGYLGPGESKAVEYKSDGEWDGTTYYGASLRALARLGESKGYNLVGCDTSGTNAFFVKSDLIDDFFIKKSVKEVYRPAVGSLPVTRKSFVDV